MARAHDEEISILIRGRYMMYIITLKTRLSACLIKVAFVIVYSV